MAHPRALRVFPDPVAVNEGLPIAPPDDGAGTLDPDGALRREGVAVPGGVMGIRRCGRHDEPEGVALSAPERHESPDAARSRKSLGDGRVDRVAWLKHETQRDGCACDIGRALQRSRTRVMDMPHVQASTWLNPLA